MAKFPSIAYIAWNNLHLLPYYGIKYGKNPIDFSKYCIKILIAWKIHKNSDRTLNSGLWIRFDRSCDITTTPIAPNKPIAIGLCAISGTMGVRPIPGIWVRRRLEASYPIWRFNKRSPPPPSVRRSMECARLRVRDKDISVVRSPLDILTMP